MDHTTRLLHLLLALFVVLAMLPLHGFARSLDASEPDGTGYDSYLVQLCEPLPVQLLEEQEGVETVVPETGLCWVDSVETAQAAIPEEAIRYIEPNYYVTLSWEPAGSEGIHIRASLPLTEAVSQVKVFFLENDTMRSLRPCLTWQAPSTTEDGA